MNEVLKMMIGEEFPRMTEVIDSYSATHGELRATQMLCVMSTFLAMSKMTEWAAPEKKAAAQALAIAVGSISMDLGVDAGLTRQDIKMTIEAMQRDCKPKKGGA